jgi:hypothetical protein
MDKKSSGAGIYPCPSIMEEIPCEHIFLPEVAQRDPYSIEVWLNKSALNTILYPMERLRKSLWKICSCAWKNQQPYFAIRFESRSAFFSQYLATKIEESSPPEGNVDIRVKCIGLLPDQVLELKIPMVRVCPDSKENKDKFKKYLKPYALDPKKMAELDALDVYYSGGIAGLLDECLSRYKCDFNPDH